MIKKFKEVQVGHGFKYGGVPFVKMPPKTLTGPRRVNALLVRKQRVDGLRFTDDWDRYYFTDEDEVTV